ncbi:MAG: flagellar motor switch protein FliN [Bryobacteraceae bacterium]|nr:flagellar motor switch protein FliN [Bryobacterales bacterium]MEB2361104.1 flagellar motor switch protein FliN [Bryobacterales bacterium]NUM99840.1 flagellar motor switch protein FliN [Bryobacteraceae bacterium]
MADHTATWLVEEWISRFGQVLESMVGERPQLEWTTAEAAAPETAPVLSWEQSFTMGNGGSLWIAAAEQTWTEIGARALEAAGLQEASVDDRRGTYIEILGQTHSALSQTLAARLGCEVTCQEATESAAAADAESFSIQIHFPGSKSVPLRLAIAPGFLDTVSASRAPEPVETVAPAVRQAPGAGRDGGPPETLDLLLEVELPVSVSFGRAYLPLKDVLRLTTGSIVELNRSVIEPVEVIVNNCVIARGEVVVVEGNYGVRIQQIIGRQERLRTLN